MSDETPEHLAYISKLGDWFSHHPATPEKTRAYETIRNAGFVLAMAIYEHSPPSTDRNAAIRKVREAVWTANAGIACDQQPGNLSLLADSPYSLW